MSRLAEQNCQRQVTRLSSSQIQALKSQLQPEWQLDPTESCLSRTLSFKNYYETIAFVNLVAWIAHQQDHHPDLQISYNKCTIAYQTHSVQGLSLNDFICAARIDTQYHQSH